MNNRKTCNKETAYGVKLWAGENRKAQMNFSLKTNVAKQLPEIMIAWQKSKSDKVFIFSVLCKKWS